MTPLRALLALLLAAAVELAQDDAEGRGPLQPLHALGALGLALGILIACLPVMRHG